MHTHTCTDTYMCAHTYTHTHNVHTHMNHTLTLIHTLIYSISHRYMHTLTHMYHTHVHLHTDTYACVHIPYIRAICIISYHITYMYKYTFTHIHEHTHTSQHINTIYQIIFSRCKFPQISQINLLLRKIYSGLWHELWLWAAIAETSTDTIMSRWPWPINI